MEVFAVKKSKRIMLYVTDEEYEKLKALADKENRSLNNYIVTLIDKALDKAAK
jgi:predicted HicB family RNase H-like nuclease